MCAFYVYTLDTSLYEGKTVLPFEFYLFFLFVFKYLSASNDASKKTQANPGGFTGAFTRFTGAFTGFTGASTSDGAGMFEW